MTFPLPVPDSLRRDLPAGTDVLLGISGGVDSAVTLALLLELGCRVQCVTFKNFCYADEDLELPEKTCCSLEAIEEARSLARRFGATHWVCDVTDPFQNLVIEPFVAEYAAARTPNPCLTCNGAVRFPELVRLADRQGCRVAATGHYARVRRCGAEAELLRGVDPAKDQSYFLHRIRRSLLPRLVFPLGWYTKQDVRRAARELALPMAAKRDSQEICFVPDGDRSFLFADTAQGVPGQIVDMNGRVLGRHRGLIHYTVGQRRGLGIAAPRPLYVVKLDPARNLLVAGYEEDLSVGRIVADRFHPLVSEFPRMAAAGPRLTARIRHRHAGTPVAAWTLDADRLEVVLAEPAAGAAPGQGLVLEDGERVLGGGRIRETRSWSDSSRDETCGE